MSITKQEVLDNLDQVKAYIQEAETPKEEKKAAFIAKAEKNKANFELHKKLITERWGFLPFDEELLKLIDYAEAFSQLQPPVISAEEFLKEKGIDVNEEIMIMNSGGVCMKVVDICLEFLQRQGQKTNQNKL